MVNVPAAEAMDDETFRKHLELRHIPVGDFADMTGFRAGSTFAATRRTMQVYHTHLHERNDYEHSHTGV